MRWRRLRRRAVLGEGSSARGAIHSSSSVRDLEGLRQRDEEGAGDLRALGLVVGDHTP